MMHPFPAERSVIVLCIHHNEELEAEVWEAGTY